MKNELEKLDAEIARDGALIRELFVRLSDKEKKRSDIYRKQMAKMDKEMKSAFAACEKRIKENAAASKH